MKICMQNVAHAPHEMDLGYYTEVCDGRLVSDAEYIAELEAKVAALSGQDEPEPEPDPMESRRITIQYEILAARGLWDRYADVTGMNPWARNEGQVSDGEMLPLTEAQAVEIGLLPAPPPSPW